MADVTLSSILSEFAEAVEPEPLWMRESRTSFPHFIQHVFMEPRHHHMAPFQETTANELGKWVKYPMGDDRRKTHQALVLWPRNFGKSTFVCGYYPCWRIGNDRNMRIIITSNTVAQGMLFLRQLEGIFLGEPKFKELYGNLVPDARTVTWTDQEKIVLGRTDPLLKDATLFTVGVGGAIINRRADIIIADDIVDTENASTAIQRKKLEKWFWESVRPVLEPGGQLLVSGTRYHSEDLYSKLIQLWQAEYSNAADAVIYEGQP